MKIIVYVEGPSDQYAMEELLGSLLRRAASAGIAISFHPTGGKKKLITKTPLKAANALRNDPELVVIALPDLYPPNVGLAHETFAELEQALCAEFERILATKSVQDERIRQRFRVYCFKHDLEALVLAAEEQLASRLGTPKVTCTWTRPVEDQDHNRPPKRIVEQVFVDYDDRYQDTVDAPLILGAAPYPLIAERCPQCFKPFVVYLDRFVQEAATL